MTVGVVDVDNKTLKSMPCESGLLAMQGPTRRNGSRAFRPSFVASPMEHVFKAHGQLSQRLKIARNFGDGAYWLPPPDRVTMLNERLRPDLSLVLIRTLR